MTIWSKIREELSGSSADVHLSLIAYQECYKRIRSHWAMRQTSSENLLMSEDVYLDGIAVTIPRWQGWARAVRKKLTEKARELPNLVDWLYN